MQINRLEQSYHGREIIYIGLQEGHTRSSGVWLDDNWKGIARGNLSANCIYKVVGMRIDPETSIVLVNETFDMNKLVSCTLDKTQTDVAGLTSNTLDFSFCDSSDYVDSNDYFVLATGYEYEWTDDQGDAIIVQDYLWSQLFYKSDMQREVNRNIIDGENSIFNIQCMDICSFFNQYTIAEYLEWCNEQPAINTIMGAIQSIFDFLEDKADINTYIVFGRIASQALVEDYSMDYLYVDKKSTETLRSLLDDLLQSVAYQMVCGSSYYFVGSTSTSVINEIKMTTYRQNEWSYTPNVITAADDIIEYENYGQKFQFKNIRVEKLLNAIETDVGFEETDTAKTYLITDNVVLSNAPDATVESIISKTKQYISNPTEAYLASMEILRSRCRTKIDPMMMYDILIRIGFNSMLQPTYELVPILGMTVDLTKGFIAEWNNETITRTVDKTKTSTVANAYKSASVRVDKLEGYVDMQVKEMSSDIATYSQIMLTPEKIEATVGKDIESIQAKIDSINNAVSIVTNKTNQWQDDSSFNQTVSNVIVEKLSNGDINISEVVAMGNRFDENGLTVYKENAKTQTTIDQTGLKVFDPNISDEEDNILLSAQASQDGTDSAVHAKNIVADTWLKVGNFRLCNVDDNGTSRVGFYFVGGTV